MKPTIIQPTIPHFPPASNQPLGPATSVLLPGKARALQGLGRGGGFFERSVVEVDRTEVPWWTHGGGWSAPK